jgi:hypothetical protein
MSFDVVFVFGMIINCNLLERSVLTAVCDKELCVICN